MYIIIIIQWPNIKVLSSVLDGEVNQNILCSLNMGTPARTEPSPVLISQET